MRSNSRRSRTASLVAFGVVAAIACGRGGGTASAHEGDAGHGEHGTEHSEHRAAVQGGGSAWAQLNAVRDSIAKDVESGKLSAIHEKSEQLGPLGEALLAGAKDVAAEKRTRIEGTLRQLPKVADSLHDAADAGKVDATRRELKRLDGVLALIRAQYPAELLNAVPAPAGAPAHEESGHEHSGHDHSHMTRPLAAVDEPPRATLHVKAAEFKFEPVVLQLKAGEPTRIELENDGLIEHALIVAAPGGQGDWIHLHAQPKSTDAGTFRIDKPGTYPLVCTIAGHTEAGMVGELTVR